MEDAETIDWRFLDFRLGLDTVHAADGARAVCVFVIPTAPAWRWPSAGKA